MMYIEIHESEKVGYVSVNPYEWEYSGQNQNVKDFLECEPEFYKWIATGHGEGKRKIVDDEEYLHQMGRELKRRNVMGIVLVEDKY